MKGRGVCADVEELKDRGRRTEKGRGLRER